MPTGRSLLGLIVLAEEEEILGTVDQLCLNPKSRTIEGLVIRTPEKAQQYVVLEAITDQGERYIKVRRRTLADEVPKNVLNPLGLRAWTTHPTQFLAGLVYDCEWDNEGNVTTFVIHQLVRTWQIPVGAVAIISEKGIWIDNDTRIKLQLTPFFKSLSDARS